MTYLYSDSTYCGSSGCVDDVCLDVKIPPVVPREEGKVPEVFDTEGFEELPNSEFNKPFIPLLYSYGYTVPRGVANDVVDSSSGRVIDLPLVSLKSSLFFLSIWFYNFLFSRVRVNWDLRYSSRSLLKNLISDSFSFTVSFNCSHYFSSFAIFSYMDKNQDKYCYH